MTTCIAIYLFIGLVFTLPVGLSLETGEKISKTAKARIITSVLFAWGIILGLFTLDFIFLVIFGHRYETYSREKLNKFFNS